MDYMYRPHFWVILFLALVPSAALAAPPNDLKELFGLLVELTNSLIVIAATLALLFFVWGLVKFIRKAGSEEAKEGKQVMIWGIIALFVIFSIWGIIAILDRTFIGSGRSDDVSPPAFFEPTIEI